MKILNIAIALFTVLVLCGCEKLDTQKDNGSATEENVSNDATVYHVSDFINGEVQENFADDNDVVIKGVWLEGYIVGYVSGTSMSSAAFRTGDKQSNIILAENPMVKQADKCVPIQLSVSPAACEEVRNALNLASNPRRLGTKVRVYGDIRKYMSVAGMKNVRKFVELPDDFDYDSYVPDKDDNTGSEDDYDDDDDDDDWDEGGKGHDDEPVIDNPLDDEVPDNGNANYPDDNNSAIHPDAKYTVREVLGPLTQHLNQYRMESIDGNVTGYIVGYVGGSKLSSTVFNANNAKDSNIVLADSPEETDPNNCIAVQLSNSQACQHVKSALNLADHPDNLHKRVSISGDIESYMGAFGLKNTYSYSFKSQGN